MFRQAEGFQAHFLISANTQAGKPPASSRLRFGRNTLADGTVATQREAVAHYTRLVKAEPHRADLRIRYGNVLRRVGRVEEALEQYHTACRLDPSSIEAHYNLLTLYDLMGNQQQAMAAGRRLSELVTRAGKLSEQEMLYANSGMQIMMRLAESAAAIEQSNRPFLPDRRAEPFRYTGPKVGRNDPCPCGSGKKFKRCCGR